MGEQPAEDFARAVSELKERSGLSYGALARRLHLSTSTLHRYCSGAAVPADYAPVERLARACGAGPRELVELHRLWVLADSARGRSRDPAPAAAEPATVEPSAAEPAPAAEPAEAPPATSPSAAADLAAADLAAPRPAAPEPAAPGPTETPPPAPEAEQLAATTPGPGTVRRRRPSWAVAAALAVLLLAATTVLALRLGGDDDGGPGGSAAPPADSGGDADDGAGQGASDTEVPLEWTVRPYIWQHGCQQDYLVDREPEGVPEPPLSQDGEEWATELDAVHGRLTIIEATLRPAGPDPVTIDALHIRVVDRATPPEWNVYTTNMGCGGALSEAKFGIDLDRERPLAEPVDGFDATEGDEGAVLPAPRLPYQITPADPLLLHLEATAADCDCSWFLEVEWSSRNERGTVRIDDGGEPFRLSGIGENPRYSHDEDWLPDPWTE